MKTKLQTPLIFLFVLSISIFSCNLASPAPVTPGSPNLPPVATPTLTPPPAATPTLTPLPTATPLPTPSPTDAPTPTIYPPVFDPAALGDNRLLDSFILTRKYVKPSGGHPDFSQETVEYIRASNSESYVSSSSSEGSVRQGQPYYLIDGQLYEKYGMPVPLFYILYPEPRAHLLDILQEAADIRNGSTKYGLIMSAKFVGQEDFQGIPANHFTFDQTNLSEQSDPTGTYKITLAQGDLFLAQNGNYLLYFHLKMSGNLYRALGSDVYLPGVNEFTEEFTSINQVNEISLPADFPALELDFGLPLPPGPVLDSVQRFIEASDHDYYDYFMPATVSRDEFLAFYRDLAPTNGWTVSRIGTIADHRNCQSQDCVILRRGSAQVILYFPAECVDYMPANDVCVWADYSR